MRADLVSGMQQTPGTIHGTSTSMRTVIRGFWSHGYDGTWMAERKLSPAQDEEMLPCKSKQQCIQSYGVQYGALLRLLVSRISHALLFISDFCWTCCSSAPSQRPVSLSLNSTIGPFRSAKNASNSWNSSLFCLSLLSALFPPSTSLEPTT